MAEFEIIGDENMAGNDVDDEEMDEATRAFLEEERANMAGLGGGDDGFDEHSGEAGHDDDFGDFEHDAPPAPADEGFEGENPFAGSQMTNTQLTGDDFGGDFHDEGAHMNGGFEGNYDLAGGDESYGTSDPYSAIGAVDEEFAEPEAVQKWRSAFASRVAEIDARSAEKKDDMLSKAKADLDTFYTNYGQQKSNTAAANREDEASFQASREDPSGADWEQVCGLCEFNPKAQVGQRDKSRMRGLLLQLKQTPLVR